MKGSEAMETRKGPGLDEWARRELGAAAIERWRREAAEERARLFGPEAETEEERARRERHEREAQASSSTARSSPPGIAFG